MFTNCKSRLQQNSNFDFPIVSFTCSPLYNLTSPISRVLIGEHLIFCSLTSPTCCNLRQKCTSVKYKKRQKAGFPIVT